MSDSSAGEAYEEWKRFDALAREAEVRLKNAWEMYEGRLGGVPDQALMRKVATLRAAANEKLTAAITAMKTVQPQRRR